MATLRVMTYNLLNGGVGREAPLTEIIRPIAPDVAVFTEVTESTALDAIAGTIGREVIVGDTPFTRAALAVVSRWPILESRRYGPPWAPHKWVEVTIRPFDGPAIRIHGIVLVPHQLWPFELWRRWEVHWLLRHVERREAAPYILAGDFNAVAPGDRVLRSSAPSWVRAQWSLQGGFVMRSALRPIYAAGHIDCFRACNEGADGYTIPSARPGARIDYVFASAGLGDSLTSSGAGATTSVLRHPSDHLPVWADFDWPVPC